MQQAITERTTTVPNNSNLAVAQFKVNRTGLYLFQPRARADVPANTALYFLIRDGTPQYELAAYQDVVVYNEGYQAGSGGMAFIQLTAGTQYYIYARIRGGTAASIQLHSSTIQWSVLLFLK